MMSKLESITYKSAGVNNALKEKCSKLFYEASKQTWENRKGRIGEIQSGYDSFSGFRNIDISNLNNAVAGTCSDGIGTKQVIAQRLSSYTKDFSYHKGIMHDLFAMPIEDALVRGAEPVLINWTINFNKPNIELAEYLAQGSLDAARVARVAIFNGETADLGNLIGGFGTQRYIADATVFWVANKKRIIDGKSVKEGDKIIAFKEEGFRSNGLTLVRKIGGRAFGRSWHEKEINGKNIAELALIPSRIYCPAVVDMFGGYGMEPRANVHAVAHITGGGIPEKIKRALAPSGLGAIIYKQFEPSEPIKLFQELGKVKDLEAYKTWNMGNGMMVITDEPEKIIAIAKEYNIEAKEAGEITKGPEIMLKNMGIYNKGEYLPF